MNGIESRFADEDHLSRLIQAIDWDIAQPEADEMLARIGPDAVPLLVDLLASSRPEVQSRAAGYLRHLGDNRAVPALANAITSCREIGCRIGSFVWALRVLDCSKLLPLIVDLALNGGYEVRTHALHILEHQQFTAAENDVDIARRHLREFRSGDMPSTADQHALAVATRAINRAMSS